MMAKVKHEISTIFSDNKAVVIGAVVLALIAISQGTAYLPPSKAEVEAKIGAVKTELAQAQAERSTETNKRLEELRQDVKSSNEKTERMFEKLGERLTDIQLLQAHQQIPNAPVPVETVKPK